MPGSMGVQATAKLSDSTWSAPRKDEAGESPNSGSPLRESAWSSRPLSPPGTITTASPAEPASISLASHSATHSAAAVADDAETSQTVPSPLNGVRCPVRR